MNTELMLKVADEIEAHPDLYDQDNGVLHPEEHGCAVCVAGHALRISKHKETPSTTTLSWEATSRLGAEALDLSSAEAHALFAPSPQVADLREAFPRVSHAALEDVAGLADWTFDDNGELCRVSKGDEPEACSFDCFWLDTPAAHEYVEWRRASARVMAAVLRLIAAADGKREAIGVRAERA